MLPVRVLCSYVGCECCRFSLLLQLLVLVFWYNIIVLILFLTLTYVISAVEYYKAEKKQQTYRNMLERLVLEYDHETSDRAGRGMKKRNGKQGGTYHGNIVGL